MTFSKSFHKKTHQMHYYRQIKELSYWKIRCLCHSMDTLQRYGYPYWRYGKLYFWSQYGSIDDSTASGKRKCCRCQQDIIINDFNMECQYHPKKKSSNMYLCCSGNEESAGCSTAPSHVWSSLKYGENSIQGHLLSPTPNPYKPIAYKVLALDTESSFTNEGLELTRVTIVDYFSRKIIYDALVKPKNPVMDYNTQFSGITEEMLEETTTTLNDVHKYLSENIDYNTILIGHGLENDLRALKLFHPTIVDTAILYPTNYSMKNGIIRRLPLKMLSDKYLHRSIQEGDSGHDSAEDAIASMDLVKYYVENNMV